MAKENIEQEEMEGAAKPSEENPAEASEKNETTTIPDEKDIEQVLMILNEVNKIQGGKGNISSIPPEIHGPVKFLVEKMVTIRDAFEDPLFKDVLDDMNDQRLGGQVPSLLVAVARNVPMEELQKVADDEGYEDVQNAVNDRVSKQKEDEESEKTLYGNFDKSKKNIDGYCKKMGYDDARKQTLYARIAKLRDIFADGLVSEEEAAEIDKIDNYDSDMETLKAQVPASGVKTVLPDKASIDESMATKKPVQSNPASIENTANYQVPAYQNVGKRKFEQRGKRG
ncbi:MAG: hypothetical protein PHT07_20910 [Paludibacter sp.]|nr:hypothetical protein [Paludibacter sp.]